MKKILTYTLLTAGFLALVGIGIVSANGDIDGFKFRTGNMDKGGMTQEQADERMERIREHRESMLEERASVLGLSVEELEAKLAEGDTCPEIAAEQGIDPEELRQQMGKLRLEHAANRLNQMVADGKITQEQADERYEQIEEQPQEEKFRLGNFHGKGGRINH